MDSLLQEVKKDARDSDGNTALMLEVKQGKIDIVEHLLADPHVDVNVKDCDGNTALMLAVNKGHIDIVDHLLADPRVDVTVEDRDRNNVFICAAINGHVDIVEHLDDERVNVNAVNKYNKNALMLAVIYKKLDIVRLLVHHPRIKVNARDIEGLTPLIDEYELRNL